MSNYQTLYTLYFYNFIFTVLKIRVTKVNISIVNFNIKILFIFTHHDFVDLWNNRTTFFIVDNKYIYLVVMPVAHFVKQNY